MPAAKLTEEIADIRGVPMGHDVLSPPSHTAFAGADGLVDFLLRLRRLSKRPVGFKMCLGQTKEAVAIVKALQQSFDKGHIPCDFISIDGGEGGTGAAPPEFSNQVGTPLKDALVTFDDLLRGAGIRDRLRIFAAGKITDGFGMTRAIALGADSCNSARAFMISLGCIQSRKCHTNHCPTGIATQDELLSAGLDIPTKALRVKNYQNATIHGAAEIIGAVGLNDVDDLIREHIMIRDSNGVLRSYEDIYPTMPTGALLQGKSPNLKLQRWWDEARVTGGTAPARTRSKAAQKKKL